MKKILIIEDEKDIREVISTLLNEEGFMVFTAKDGQDGITIAQKEIPDLIISDIVMPGSDGYTVLRELSKNNSTKTIPFIFLTAKVERDDLRFGMELGADDYLFKPFRSDELLKSISSRLSRIAALKAEFTKNAEETLPKKYTADDKIIINASGNPHFIRINQILFIAAERQYTSIKLLDGKSYLLRKSISKWEDLLPIKNFLRIHRSTIINIDFLVKMEKWYNSSFLVHLKNVPEPFEISKRYATKLRKKNNP